MKKREMGFPKPRCRSSRGSKVVPVPSRDTAVSRRLWPYLARLALLLMASFILSVLSIRYPALCKPQQGPCDPGYGGEFVRSEYDPESGTTTFYYRVTQGSGNAISHWMIVLPSCIECSEIVDVSPEGGVCGSDGSTGKYGIKWDHGFSGDSQEFSITLSGYRTEEEPGPNEGILVKYGNKYCITPVKIPSCDPSTPPTPLSVSVQLSISDSSVDQPDIGLGYVNLGTLTVTVTAKVNYAISIYYNSVPVLTDDPLFYLYDDVWHQIRKTSIALYGFSGTPPGETRSYNLRVALSKLGNRDWDAGDTIDFTIHVMVNPSSP